MECRRRSAVPRFIRDRVKTRSLFEQSDYRAAECENPFGQQILSMFIRKEFLERNRLRRAAVENRLAMNRYNKEDYLFMKTIKDSLLREKVTSSRERLEIKLNTLSGNNEAARCTSESFPSQSTRERVTCIDIRP